MRDSFHIGRVLDGLLPRLVPIPDCLGGETCLGAVLRQPCRLLLEGLRKAFFEHRRDAGVQLLAGPAQQRAVCGILHQRVLEEIYRLRRQPPAEQQAGVDKPVKGCRQTLAGVQWRDRID